MGERDNTDNMLVKPKCTTVLGAPPQPWRQEGVHLHTPLLFDPRAFRNKRTSFNQNENTYATEFNNSNINAHFQ